MQFLCFFAVIYPKTNDKYGANCPQNDISDEFLEDHKNMRQHSIVLKLRIRVKGATTYIRNKRGPRAVENGRLRPLRRKKNLFFEKSNFMNLECSVDRVYDSGAPDFFLKR